MPMKILTKKCLCGEVAKAYYDDIFDSEETRIELEKELNGWNVMHEMSHMLIRIKKYTDFL